VWGNVIPLAQGDRDVIGIYIEAGPRGVNPTALALSLRMRLTPEANRKQYKH